MRGSTVLTFYFYSMLRQISILVLMLLTNHNVADLNGPLHDHVAITYGITDESILNSSRYFHVLDGLVPDIMHDMLEGTLQVTMKCVLRHLIQDQNLFSLKTLNNRISSFHYGQANVQNRPSEITRSSLNSSSDTLRQSGMHLEGPHYSEPHSSDYSVNPKYL